MVRGGAEATAAVVGGGLAVVASRRASPRLAAAFRSGWVGDNRLVVVAFALRVVMKKKTRE